MPSVRLQFHAEPEELVHEARRWALERDLSVALERFSPDYRAVRVAPADLIEVARALGGVDRVGFGVRPLDVSATSAHQFVSRNSGCLTLLIGTLSDEGLREAFLAGGSDDEDTIRTWRSIKRRARSAMHKGARVRNPFTGDEAPRPSHCHTPGAHALAARGVRMLGIAGSNEYLFDDVDLLD